MSALAAEAETLSTWRNPGGAALVRGDACAIPLGDNTVDLIVTSPPYFALRSYQDGGEHYDGQIGSEATPTAFLEALWAVTAECWRVLKPTGSLFVNLGDKYAGTGGGNGQSGIGGPRPTGDHDARSMPTNNTKQTSGFVRAKSLMGLPWRYAIGCIDGNADPEGRGWVLRSEIIWAKPNGLPESVQDRVRRSHEQWFMFTKNGTYYSNVDEIRESRSEVVEGPPQHLPGCPLFVGPSHPLASALVERGHERHAGVELFDLPHQERADERVHGEHVVRAEQPRHAGFGSPVPLAERGYAEFGADPVDLLNDRRRSVVDGDPQMRGAVTAMREADRALSVDDPGEPCKVCTCGHATYHSTLGKLPDSVWTIATQPLVVPEWLGVDHFAAFPTEWPRKLILGWTPSGICTACGEGRRSTTDKTVGNPGYSIDQRERTSISGGPPSGGNVTRVITGEACACPDTSAPTTPAIVLDPFGGTGTTAMVAKALGRYGISLDLSADYLKLARWRVFNSGHGDKAIARTNTEAQLDIFDTLNGPQETPS